MPRLRIANRLCYYGCEPCMTFRARKPSIGSLLLLLGLACGSPPKPELGQDERGAVTDRSPSAAKTPAAPSEAPAPAEPTPATATLDTTVEAVLAYDPKDPLANLEAADALDRMAKGEDRDVKPKPSSCAILHEGRRVWPAPGPAAIVGLGRGFVVAGYAMRGGREQLFVVHVGPDALPDPITAFDLDPPHPQPRKAAPGLAARDDNDLAIAYTDGKGRLHARRLRVGRSGGGAALQLAPAVDTRFAPAVAVVQDRTLVAYTLGSTPMHTSLAVLMEDRVIARHELTPSAMGAAAPSFVHGASPPVLVMVDARDGLSPLLRVDLNNDGTPKPAAVVLPLSTVSMPARLAAASSSIGTYVGYTGLGSAATSAVGLLAISPIVGKPEALVKGTGYGILQVSATSAPRAVLFAADAPITSAKDAPREIRVHVVGMEGPGEASVLRGASGAGNAAIARDEAGDVGVVFTSASGVYLAKLRCDDG
jgi:hypothetical protein